MKVMLDEVKARDRALRGGWGRKKGDPVACTDRQPLRSFTHGPTVL